MIKYSIKNIFIVFFTLVSISAIIISSGCTSTEEPVYEDPLIEFVTDEGFVYSDTSLKVNESILVGLHMTSQSDKEIVHFNTTIDRDGQVTSLDTALFNYEIIVQMQIPKSLAGTETWSFYCRDGDSRKSEVLTLTLIRDSSLMFSGIKYMPDIRLGAQNNTENGSFYSIFQDSVMNLSGAFANQENVNLVYYYDTIDEDANTISSPGANIDASIFAGTQGLSNWTTKNTVRFVQRDNISRQEFESFRTDSLIFANTFDFSAGKRKAKTLAAGHVYSFVTESGQLGLFLVKEIVGQEAGSILFSIKMLD